jgi:RNA polymerase sigma-70 factor (ECF subfamily)
MDEASGDLWTYGVIEQNRRWMLAYVQAAIGDPAAAEDVVQETFLTAYRKRKDYRPGEAFGAWLRGIARNLVRRHLEQRTRGPVVLLSDEAWSVLDARAAALELAHVTPGFETERISALRRCVEKLTDRARSLIEGRYGQGLSVPDLAARLHLAPASVPVVLHRARSALNECLQRNLARGGA